MNVGTAPSLEPLTVGQILDRAFRLYRRRFLTFVGIIAVVLVPLTVIQMGATVVNLPSMLTAMERYTEAAAYPGYDPGYGEVRDLWGGMSGILWSSLAFALIQLVLVQSLATAALARAVGDSTLGKITDIVGAYRRVGPVWLRLLGAILLGFLTAIALGIFAIIPCVGWLIGPGVLIYYAYVIYAMLPPILVLEGQTVGGAFRRAWDLARRRLLWTLGFMLILQALSWVIVGGPMFMLQIGLNYALRDVVATDPVMAATIQTVIQWAVRLLLNLLYLPLQMTAITLMYFDLRVRTEGFDLALLAATAGGEPGVEGVEVAAQAPRPERGNLVTGNEIATFVAVSITGIIVLVIYNFFSSAISALITPLYLQ